MTRKLSAEEIERREQEKFEKSMVTNVVGYEEIEDDMEITGDTIEKLIDHSSIPDNSIDEETIG
ncbi:hypothetical protein HYT95_00880 [Candidatus Peregrinibacteria bacterium]|nr:hypothetical protein [Candidatus Peregrinibacteria bacterium]